MNEEILRKIEEVRQLLKKGKNRIATVLLEQLIGEMRQEAFKRIEK